MVRGKGSTPDALAPRPRATATPPRRMGTSEARAGFSKLVAELSQRDEPSDSLADNAIEIGPQRKGGVWLVPELDAQAAVEHIQELEDEIENIAIAFLIEERRQRSSGKAISGSDLIRELGFPKLAEGLPE